MEIFVRLKVVKLSLCLASLVVHLVSQDLSIAGKRAGLAGDKSGLFIEMIRVIAEMRTATNGEYPKFAVWENVCFEGNTLITCESGYKNIKDVCIGDKVKTLSGKFLPVVKTYRTDSVDTIKVHVSGGEDIVCTENHPFYVREKIYTGNIRSISEPKWVCAGELTKNHLVAYRLDEPSLPENFISKEEAWALGRYIADGSVDLKKNTPRIFISVGDYKIDEAREHLYKLPYDIYENKPHSTATNFVFSSSQFYSLVSKVGIGAGNKQIPPFVFELPISLQKEVLNGYCCGDGYIRNRGNTKELTASTASRVLAYGVARLIRNVYHIAANISVYPPKNGCINGRILKANYPNYVINACLTTKVTLSIYEDNIMWQPVKGVAKNGKADVYNLSVMEDNTYGANDVFVHNCGAFSSNNGEDFRCVLENFARIAQPNVSIPRPNNKWAKSGAIIGDNWSIAWRLMDARGWGIPQRRERIALVTDFRGQSAPKILFERESLPRNFKTSRESWEGASGSNSCSINRNNRVAEESKVLVLNDQGGSSISYSENFCNTLRSQEHGHQPCAIALHQNASGEISFSDNSVYTLSTNANASGRSTPLVAIGCYNFAVTGDTCATLTNKNDGSHSGPQIITTTPQLLHLVRRLTPTECERLQGYPDNWTDIGEWRDSFGKKRDSSDTSRYKALGNSICTPQWLWIVKRMKKYLPNNATLGSLFDGIGGFPLVWETTYGKGTAKWASEIEEFPIAVTKVRFPE